MTATDGAPKTVFERHARLIMAAIGLASVIGAATTFYVYKQYADVWLRRPPRMPACVRMARGLLATDAPVTGSIPHPAPDGTMVYLRPAEDRAVRCLNRISSKTASAFAVALAEVDPDKRAQAFAAVARQFPADPSGDAEALATYLMSSAAFRALPKTPEIEAIHNELDQSNACRFSMRTPCPSRPPIPMTVWITGAPSTIGLAAVLGWSGKAIIARLRAWRDKRRAAKKSAKKELTPAPATQENE
jgi:hypothetical protein